MFNFFRLCRKDEISFDIVAVCGNKVECCFDNVDGLAGTLLFGTAPMSSLHVVCTKKLFYIGCLYQRTETVYDSFVQ